MATDVAEPRGEPVSIGRVIERGFAVIAANPATILGISVALGVLPALLLAFVTAAAGSGGSIADLGGGAGLLNIVNFILSLLAHGAIVHAATAHFDGRGRAGFAESLAASLGVLLSMIGLAIVIFLGFMFGFALLVVPGVMIYVLWSVASPALVAEREGAFAALGRSRRLTKGARWRVFGLQLILLVAYFLVVGTLGYGTVAASGGVKAIALGGAAAPVAVTIFTSVVATLATIVWSTVQTALYVELRDWHDGPTVDRLADVFA